ncbi:MAG: hypothetical protein IJE77_06580, partial [Thermoguttaceae bacterium]|nr:hypothetical protein [Thermoguttaceae bacterium]
PCAAFASDAPVYSPSPCAPVATCSPSPPVPVCAPVAGPVGEGVATETNVGTACPGGVCSLNITVGTSGTGGVCPLGANACENGRCEIDVGGASGFCSVAVGSNVGVGGAKKVHAWSRTVSRCGQTGFARTSFVRNICAARQTASSRRAVATVVVRSTGTCATATAAPPLPCAPVCR